MIPTYMGYFNFDVEPCLVLINDRVFRLNSLSVTWKVVDFLF